MEDALEGGDALTTEDGIEIVASPTTIDHDGSRQRELWGINLYPAHYGSPDWLEFDSTINLHPSLTQERWGGLSLAGQLANIGTEVARAARAKGKNDEVRLQQHLDLALELFEFTLDDERWRGQRVEIGRTREVVCDFLVGENEYESSEASLDAYFLPFTYLSLRAASPPRTDVGRTSQVTDPPEPSGAA